MSVLLLLAFSALFLLTDGVAQAQSQDATCAGRSALTPGLSQVSFQSGGIERTFLISVPSGYDGVTRVPLVLSIHGFASNAEQQRTFSQWDVLGEQENFLSVFPQGTGFPPRWNAGAAFDFNGGTPVSRAMGAQVDDVAFFNHLLDRLEADFCIDTARIYATGLSNGGGMSNRLACEMADRITAIGTVSGAYTDLPGGCHPSRPVPVIAYHGQADPIVPYEGGMDGLLPSIESWAQDWADLDGCTDVSVSTNSAPNGVTTRAYGGCTDGVEVVLHTIPDGGHSWPGGTPLPEFLVGKTRTDIDATGEMWAFFQRFSIR